MEGNMLVRFYTSAASKQNIWLELECSEGMRYEINNMEDVKHSIECYIREHTGLFGGNQA